MKDMILQIAPNENYAVDLMRRQYESRNQTFAIFTCRLPKSTILSQIRSLSHKNFSSTVFSSDMVVLNEDLRTHHEVFIVRSESYIIDVLNDFILRCHQHGFFKYFESQYFETPEIIVEDARKILTFNMLSAGFYLWLISIVVACLVFIVEHVVRYFSRTRKLRKLGPRVTVYKEYDCTDEDSGKLKHSTALIHYFSCKHDN